MNVVRSNKRCLLLLVLLAVSGLGITYGLMALERGIYYCGHCVLRTPDADPATTEFIKKIRAPISRLPLLDFATGSRYTVCNPMYCATYEQLFDNSFLAKAPARRRTDSPGQPPRDVNVIDPPPRQPPAPQPGPWNPAPAGPGSQVCVNIGKATPLCRTQRP